MLIKGAPEDRRSFLDQALLLDNPAFVPIIREFRLILEQRNSLLRNDCIDYETYFIWSQKLWEKTSQIQKLRKYILENFEIEINKMLSLCFENSLTLSFSYIAKKKSDLSFNDFWLNKDSLLKEEQYFKRTLFGVHLDDFIITLAGKKSSSFASRGQQKMIVLLIKAAQIKYLTLQKGPVIFLLDDFMTDFDPQKGAALLSVLFTLKCQLVFTSPHQNSPLEAIITNSGYQFKKITI
jgi:DNA replication and repair protein RecF